jgi:hypothetical protein
MLQVFEFPPSMPTKAEETSAESSSPVAMSASLRHTPRLAAISDAEVGASTLLDLLNTGVGIVVSQRQPLVRIDVEAGHLRDDYFRAPGSCQREVALLLDLWFAIFGRMGHDDENFRSFGL